MSKENQLLFSNVMGIFMIASLYHKSKNGSIRKRSKMASSAVVPNSENRKGAVSNAKNKAFDTAP